ncbi:uncharacterized protein PV09_01319 [Verruconis gallopava]|uniref:Uncharacterized protein n=1 Tax=Verruconis gallopava TaxID=253628 RepID=A0A0D2ANZ8_9PEZI|nr:uncharacterized protein PV09_01319 [Verruconis gallopava]KIW08413.1 hypothetical protein PV09_01319 [Verruconis gallopava]
MMQCMRRRRVGDWTWEKRRYQPRMHLRVFLFTGLFFISSLSFFSGWREKARLCITSTLNRWAGGWLNKLISMCCYFLLLFVIPLLIIAFASSWRKRGWGSKTHGR